jgi:hypothetical protein
LTAGICHKNLHYGCGGRNRNCRYTAQGYSLSG